MGLPGLTVRNHVRMLAMFACLMLTACASSHQPVPAPEAGRADVVSLTPYNAALLQQACTALNRPELGQFTAFHPRVAYTAAAFSQLVYLPESIVRTCLAERGFSLLGYFDLQPADYQFFAAKGMFKGRKVYIVSVRGSDSSEDWITNMQLANRGLKDTTIQGRVHQGFLGYAEAVYNQIAWNDATRPLLTEISMGKADLLITGHSLGGAVGLIFTAMMRGIGVPPVHMQTYTFGAPAVGDMEFSRANDTGKIFRIELEGDPVPFAASISPWLYEQAKRHQDEGIEVDATYQSLFMHIGKSYTFNPRQEGFTEADAALGTENRTFLLSVVNNLIALHSSKYDVLEHDITSYMTILDKHLHSEEGQALMQRLAQP